MIRNIDNEVNLLVSMGKTFSSYSNKIHVLCMYSNMRKYLYLEVLLRQSSITQLCNSHLDIFKPKPIRIKLVSMDDIIWFFWCQVSMREEKYAYMSIESRYIRRKNIEWLAMTWHDIYMTICKFKYLNVFIIIMRVIFPILFQKGKKISLKKTK